MKRLLPLLLLAAACVKSGAFPTEVKLEGALYAERCGDVTAEWLGAVPEGNTPRSFGTESLRFRFSDSVLPFEPAGALAFADWNYEIFSPDCAWALLLQDSSGPYHLVSVPQLKAYLQGGGPAAIVQHQGATGAVGIHHSQRWLSATQFEFFSSCCGGVEVLHASVDQPTALTSFYFAASAPRGIRRLPEGGFEVVQ